MFGVIKHSACQGENMKPLIYFIKVQKEQPMLINKILVCLCLALGGVNYAVTNGDCETDNGKRIDNCVIKGEK